MKIKNWSKFQTRRKDRESTPWIKLHRRALMSPTWHQMDDKMRGQFVALLLLADSDGILATDNPAVLQSMAGMSEPPDLQRFFDLGLLDGDGLATTWQPNVPPEKEIEKESEREIERKKDSPPPKRRGPTYCPEDWKPSESDIEWATSKGFLPSQMEDVTEQMVYWSQGNGKKRTNWGLVWRNWLKREGAGAKRSRNSDENSAAKWSKIREDSRKIDLESGGQLSGELDAELPRSKQITSRMPDSLAPSIGHDFDWDTD